MDQQWIWPLRGNRWITNRIRFVLTFSVNCTAPENMHIVSCSMHKIGTHYLLIYKSVCALTAAQLMWRILCCTEDCGSEQPENMLTCIVLIITRHPGILHSTNYVHTKSFSDILNSTVVWVLENTLVFHGFIPVWWFPDDKPELKKNPLMASQVD